MAINYPNFLNAPSAESPWKNALESVLKGYKMAEEPAKMQQESTQRDLANQLKKLEVDHKPTEYALTDKGKQLANALHAKALEHYEEKFELEKRHKEAQIAKLTQKGLQSGMKLNGAVANAEAIYQLEHDPNADPEHVKALKDAFNIGQEHTESITNRSKDVVAGNAFDKQPINDKKQSVALMKGMAVDPVEAVRYLRQPGHSPTTYAEEKGIDISTVVPDYAAGEQNIKEAQQADAYLEELESFEKHINQGLGEYQNKVLGYSFKQIADSANGKNTDKVARALAARALLPELNAVRLKVMKANVGIEALRELEHKSLGNLKVIESMVDTKTFNKMQQYMSDWIKEAARRRTSALKGFSMLKTKLQKSAEAESRMGDDPLGLF